MDQRRSGRHEALRAAFASALLDAGMDPGLAHRCEIDESSFSGTNIHHAARYAPHGRDFFTVGDHLAGEALAAEMRGQVARLRDLIADAASILAACDRIRQRAEEAFAPAGISGLRARFAGREADALGRHTVTAMVEYEGIDDMLKETPHQLTLHDPHDANDHADPLVRAPAAQILRKALLAGHHPRDARRISGHLVRAISALTGDAVYDIISRIDTTQYRTEEPDDYETHGIKGMIFIDGTLQATIAIGPGHLDGDDLTMPGVSLPETVLLALPGRRAGTIVDHPIVTDRRIVAARNDDEKGALVLVIEDRPLPLEATLERMEDQA